jgi:hypothetical protein
MLAHSNERSSVDPLEHSKRSKLSFSHMLTSLLPLLTTASQTSWWMDANMKPAYFAAIVVAHEAFAYTL